MSTATYTPDEQRVYDSLGIADQIKFQHRSEFRERAAKEFDRKHGLLVEDAAVDDAGPVEGASVDKSDDLTAAAEAIERAKHSTPPPTPTFAITVFDSDDTLSKGFDLNDGKLHSRTAANLTKAVATRHEVNSLIDYGALLDSLTLKHAVTFGVFDHPECTVRTAANVESGATRNGLPLVARTKEHMQWPDGPGVMLLDYDPLPGAEALSPEALVRAVRGAVPVLADVSILWRPSSSSYVRNAATQECRGLRGQHLYLVAKDAKHIKEVGDILFDRLWLTGHGGILIGKDGRLHDKTLVDRAVWQPERLDFIRADCGPGVEQHMPAARVFEGANDYIDGETWLDPDDVVPLTDAERLEVKRLKRAARAARADEAAVVRAAWKEKRADEAATKAKALGEAFDRESFKVALDGRVLPPETVLHLKDGGTVTVREVLDDLAGWQQRGLDCADPAEPDYGGDDRRIAILTSRGTIFSHAHGGQEFYLTEADAKARAPAAADEFDAYSTKEDFTDKGNANLLARLTAGDLRFITERKVWLAWSNGRWEVDRGDVLSRAGADLVAKHYADEVARLTLQINGMDRDAAKRHQKTIDAVASWEKVCRNRRGIDNMIALASTLPGVAISETVLDTNPHLLGVQNGVLDLRTGDLRPYAREDFVTQRCAFAYNKHAPGTRWREFIDEVTGAPIPAEADDEGNVIGGTVGRFTPRPAFAGFLQRAIGYSATGLTREHKMFVPFGEHGSNGKNVFTDVLVHVFGGDYAVTTSPKLLLASRRDSGDANSATPAFVKLKGSRFAVGSEPPAGSSFDPSVLKALTGNATISARALHQGEASFAVTFHLWLLCNAKPRLQNLESAVAGRLLMLPFDRRWNRPDEPERDPSLPDADKTLLGVLSADGEGVLAWIVEGAVRYFAEGLRPCADVVEASRAYIKSQRVDPVAKWIDEETLPCAASIGTTAAALFDAFTQWRTAREAAGSLRAGDSPLTAMAFGVALKKRDIEKTKRFEGWSLGLRLRSEFDA
jgi:P4 family phage/plasmid primase-like protien